MTCGLTCSPALHHPLQVLEQEAGALKQALQGMLAAVNADNETLGFFREVGIMTFYGDDPTQPAATPVVVGLAEHTGGCNVDPTFSQRLVPAAESHAVAEEHRECGAHLPAFKTVAGCAFTLPRSVAAAHSVQAFPGAGCNLQLAVPPTRIGLTNIVQPALNRLQR
jgi:hypothetical protein